MKSSLILAQILCAVSICCAQSDKHVEPLNSFFMRILSAASLRRMIPAHMVLELEFQIGPSTLCARNSAVSQVKYSFAARAHTAKGSAAHP